MSKSVLANGTIDQIFAIGCFNFVLNSTIEIEDFYENYSSYVEDTLGKIDNVSNIVITDVDRFLDMPAHPTKSDGYSNIAFHPCPASGHVAFDVFIPKRVQEEVFPYESPRIECERFEVLIEFAGDFPITIIRPGQPLNQDLSPGFSDFVPIVRNYLASRWPSDGKVKFACLGPSPFHADFYFRRNTTHDLHVETRKGYDKIIFDGESIVEFYRHIFAIIPNYYSWVYTRNCLNDTQHEISTNVRLVIDRLTERNLFKQIYNSIVYSNKRDIADIYSLDFESSEAKTAITHRISYSKKKDGAYSDSPLWRFVDDEISEDDTDSKEGVGQLLRLAEIFEMGGATNSSTVFAALASALLTALAAVLIAVLADGPSQGPAPQITAAPIVGQTADAASAAPVPVKQPQ